MAAIYKHARDGHQIHYTVYFPSGGWKKKYRAVKDRKKAIRLLNDVERLEALSREMKLTKEQIIYALHHHYINESEAKDLACTDNLLPVSLNDLMPHYEAYARKHWNRRTQKSYLCTTQRILDAIGDIQIIDPEQYKDTVDKYICSLSVSNRTKNIYLDRIRQMIAIGIEKRLLPFSVNPIASIRHFPDKAVRLPRALSYDEAEHVIRESRARTGIGGLMYQCTLAFIFAGLRLTELKYLTWDDIMSDRILIQPKHIAPAETDEPLAGNLWQPKTRSTRAIFIDDARWQDGVLKLLRKIKKIGRFVFGGHKSISRHALQSAYNQRLFRGKPYSLHCLRHTFITWRIESGDPLPRVMYLAGHANIETTMRYTHVAEQKPKDLLKLIRA